MPQSVPKKLGRQLHTGGGGGGGGGRGRVLYEVPLSYSGKGSEEEDGGKSE